MATDRSQRPRRARRLARALAGASCAFATAAGAQAPQLSRSTSALPTTMLECKARARAAFELEGYRINQEAADAYRAAKGPFSALVTCGYGGPADVKFDVVVAGSTGDVEGERERLEARISHPPKTEMGTY